MRLYRPPPFPLAHRPHSTPLSSASLLDREALRSLAMDVAGAAEAIYPEDGRATVSADLSPSGTGWEVRVLLGLHYLHLDGFASERNALLGALRVLRRKRYGTRRPQP